jgi:hypothetical protein
MVDETLFAVQKPQLKHISIKPIGESAIKERKA